MWSRTKSCLNGFQVAYSGSLPSLPRFQVCQGSKLPAQKSGSNREVCLVAGFQVAYNSPLTNLVKGEFLRTSQIEKKKRLYKQSRNMPLTKEEIIYRENQSDEIWITSLSAEQASELNNWITMIFKENIDLEDMPKFVSKKKLEKDFRDWIIYGAISSCVKGNGKKKISVLPYFCDLICAKKFNSSVVPKEEGDEGEYVVPKWLRLHINSCLEMSKK